MGEKGEEVGGRMDSAHFAIDLHICKVVLQPEF